MTHKRYVLVLTDEGVHSVPGIIRLRRLCKWLLRVWGLRPGVPQEPAFP